MSGHNKWSKIKRAKEVKDKVKGNVFSKMSRLITLAVIEAEGITDPNNNIKLRMVIDKAKEFNMPKENIDRAIKNGIGPDKSQIKEITFEVFGPGGSAFVILTATDNPKRTLSEVRNTVEKHAGKLGNQGSVLYLFKKCAFVKFNKKDVNEENVFTFGDRIGAFDIDQDENSYSIFFPFERLGKIKDYLQGLKTGIAEVDFKPYSPIDFKDKVLIKKNLDLSEALDNLDDVHKVFFNFELPNESLS